MGPCIANIFQYISNKMQLYTVYLYLETALHASGGTSTHHLERIQLYLQHLVFVTPLLLSAPIVAGLDGSGEGKTSYAHWGLNPNRPALSELLYRLRYSGPSILLPKLNIHFRRHSATKRHCPTDCYKFWR